LVARGLIIADGVQNYLQSAMGEGGPGDD